MVCKKNRIFESEHECIFSQQTDFLNLSVKKYLAKLPRLKLFSGSFLTLENKLFKNCFIL